ncbi:hypothetical protein KK083_02555 [Fulvivirgaceae bacterium PWU4]|uniref:Transporter n=1 Tax=Chryseosolibacter histidini TaxID=2782349 RepID=A0AAP2DGF8_9BACT|nr:hypothetical protein [Chryseosolibacter histidini]MBT1695741.1 hypothetical protein [Chryseosolibacter histidini]
MKKCLAIIYTFLLLVSGNVFSQGCSDAGFCTMGAMKPDQPFNKKIELRLRSMELSFYRGTTTLTPVIYVATADLNFSLNTKTSFQVKLPYQAVRGRLANTSGMGDISLCLTRNVLTRERFDINVSLGAKIPTNHSDKDVNGLPLPMYYQTSLGTYDAIAGLSLITRQWLFATGIQVPLNKNDNGFIWSAWDGSDEKAYVDRYNQAKDLKRGTDVMLRVERNFRFSRLNFSLGLLPIYRITRDEFNRSGKDAGSAETRIIHPVARGLALSGIFTAGYNFDVRSGVKLLLGHKIVQRDINPDGLTRELVSSISYYYRF